MANDNNDSNILIDSLDSVGVDEAGENVVETELNS